MKDSKDAKKPGKDVAAAKGSEKDAKDSKPKDAKPEKPLPGTMTPVARAGDEVRREAGPWTPTVQRLLTHLRDNGVTWCPEPRGYTSDGRETLSYLKGKVPTYPLPDYVYDEAVLTTAAQWMRQLHDLTADFDDGNQRWRAHRRKPVEAICHNDFAPYNMVFKTGELVGLIDWDFAAPGPRLWDLSYLAYRLGPLMRPTNPAVPNLSLDIFHRVQLLLDAYGSDVSVPELLGAVVDRLEDLGEFTSAVAAKKKDEALASDARNYAQDAEYLRSLLPS